MSDNDEVVGDKTRVDSEPPVLACLPAPELNHSWCYHHSASSIKVGECLESQVGAGRVAVVGVVDDGNSRRACQRLAPMFSNGKVCQLFGYCSVGDAKGCGYRYCARYVRGSCIGRYSGHDSATLSLIHI